MNIFTMHGLGLGRSERVKVRVRAGVRAKVRARVRVRVVCMRVVYF